MAVDDGRTSAEEFVTRYELPRADWRRLWESIYVDDRIKERIVNFGLLERRFSRGGFEKRSLGHHGAVLLSGPPGTGKTSLAKGGADRLARRLDVPTVYKEINVQRLFSSGFGDTPTLVEEAFEQGVLAPAEHGDVFQVLLLDEVESVFSSRDMLGSSDPFDAIRAVNQALRQLDRIAEVDDVYVIATSNQPSGIDRAFYDRTDEQLYVGNPGAEQRGRIFAEVFGELGDAFGADLPTDPAEMEELVAASEGFSGRRIRKTVLSALTREADTIERPGALAYDAVVEEFGDKRDVLERGDRDYVELGIDPGDGGPAGASAEDGSGRGHGEAAGDGATGAGGREGAGPAGGHGGAGGGEKPEAGNGEATGGADGPDGDGPGAGEDGRAAGDGTTPEDGADDAPDGADGDGADGAGGDTADDGAGDGGGGGAGDGDALEPRVVVLDRTGGEPHRALRRSVVDFLADTLEHTGVDSDRMEAVLGSDELDDFWYRLCMTRSLRGIVLTVGDVRVPVEVSYDQGAESRLAPPSPDVFTGGEYDAATVTVVADGDAARRASVDVATGDITVEVVAGGGVSDLG